MANHVCPWWLGYLLASPLRRLFQDPEKILAPYIEKGMKVLDFGCAMGFFSLPSARMAGRDGRVICIDLQEKMIRSLEKRAAKAGLSDRIETRVCAQNSFGTEDIAGEMDFALAFAVVHEVPDRDGLFSALHKTLKPEGKLLVAEPPSHVTAEEFSNTVTAAQRAEFEIIDRPKIKRSHTVLLRKKTNT
ncbi:MAG: methyltransferase domain-containing protein [Candidatus Aminicenantes bacterium]|nr:MAG: methyltransferase domain-containing protein [Candidatus Aminicenantes bacterium]